MGQSVKQTERQGISDRRKEQISKKVTCDGCGKLFFYGNLTRIQGGDLLCRVCYNK